MGTLDKLRSGEIDTDHGLKRKVGSSRIKAINISITCTRLENACSR